MKYDFLNSITKVVFEYPLVGEEVVEVYYSLQSSQVNANKLLETSSNNISKLNIS